MADANYDRPSALSDEDKATLRADPSQWVAIDDDTFGPALPDARPNLCDAISEDEPWLLSEHKADIPVPIVDAGRLKFTISRYVKEVIDPPEPMRGGGFLVGRWTTTVDRVVEVLV